MAYFAILKENNQDFEVRECHINLWCLPGLCRRVFYFDVGLRVKPNNSPLKTFRMALPFGTEIYPSKPDSKRTQIVDLKKAVSTPESAQLIFGDEVRYEDNQKKIVTSGFTATLCDIDISNSKSDKEKSAKDYSIWTISLVSEVAKDEEAYLRMRF